MNWLERLIVGAIGLALGIWVAFIGLVAVAIIASVNPFAGG